MTNILASDVNNPTSGGPTEHSGEDIKVVQVIKLTPTGQEGIVLLENGDYKFGDLVFYPAGECFYRNGNRINVPNLECKLMKILLTSKHCNLKREQIIKELWGKDKTEKECNDKLNSTVWRLKRDLKNQKSTLRIESERAKGYELCVIDEPATTNSQEKKAL